MSDLQAWQVLIERGVPLFSGAIVGQKPDGDYIVCNFVPGLDVNGTGFKITRQWIAGGMGVFGIQWYELHDERSDQ